jgi:hypothetical protein
MTLCLPSDPASNNSSRWERFLENVIPKISNEILGRSLVDISACPSNGRYLDTAWLGIRRLSGARSLRLAGACREGPTPDSAGIGLPCLQLEDRADFDGETCALRKDRQSLHLDGRDADFNLERASNIIYVFNGDWRQPGPNCRNRS